MEEELSRQYGQLGLSDNMGMDSMPLDGEDSLMKADGTCNLIVNYLPHDVDDLSLRALFQDFGEIIMTKVVRDKNTKKSMGYGFVKFLNEESAMVAIDKMNGFSLGHKNLKVSIARPPSLEIRNCKLYVTNLPKDYSEREVIALFKEFGDIIECRVLKDRNSKINKGVAFVQFNVKSQANNALSLNGCQLEGSNRPLVVKYAEDQHKKKELSRLHNLTINNAFRGMSSGPMGPMGGMGNPIGNPMGGPAGGMGAGMPSPKSRDKNSDMLNTAYFYQQQGLPSLYPPPSPMSMASPMLSPLNSTHSPTNTWFNTLQPPQMQFMHPGQNQVPGLQLNSLSSDANWGMGMMPPRGINVAGGMSPKGMGMPGMHAMEHPRGMDPMSRNPGMPIGMGYPAGSHNPNGGAGPSLHSPLGHMSPHPLPSPTAAAANANHYGGVSLSIANLPTMADMSMLHDLCAPYGRVISAGFEDNRRGGNGGQGGGQGGNPGPVRGRVQVESLAQAEVIAQALHGAFVFEGCPPLQVQILMNGSPAPPPQHRM